MTLHQYSQTPLKLLCTVAMDGIKYIREDLYYMPHYATAPSTAGEPRDPCYSQVYRPNLEPLMIKNLDLYMPRFAMALKSKYQAPADLW